MPVPIALRKRFVLLAALIFCGEALGYAACLLTGTLPPQPAAWGAFLVAALVGGGVATVLLDRLVPDQHRPALSAQEASARQELEQALENRIEQQRRLRHDIRGVLSPVLLIADRLLNHADPAVRRSGEIMVRTVDRATALLAESGGAPPSPPDDP